MKNRNVVKQDYHLVNAKYKLNTSEIKFIMTALVQIDTDDKEFQEYEIKVSELEAKLQKEQNETRLKQFAKKLMSKPLEVSTEDGWVIFNWFSKIQYIRGQAKFLVRIDEDLKPYLLELKERFVKYNLKYILPLSSNYSIRLYQLLKEYEKLTRRTFTVTELQELLQVPKSLKVYADFKRKVLKVAERELIENCDIFFEFEEIKEGRKVNELLFRIKSNKSVIDEDQPKLFDIKKGEFDQYLGRAIPTVQGTKTIMTISRNEVDLLDVRYLDGTFTILQNITHLQFALGDITQDEVIELQDVQKSLKKANKGKTLTEHEEHALKLLLGGEKS